MPTSFSDYNNELDWISVNSLSNSEQKNIKEQLNTWHEPGINKFVIGRSGKELGDLLFRFININNFLYVAKENGVDIATMLINPSPMFSYTVKLLEHSTNISADEFEVENVLSLDRTQTLLSINKDNYLTNLGFLVVSPEHQGNNVARRCLSSLTENPYVFSPYEPIVSTVIRKDNHRSIRVFEASGFEKIINDDINEQNFNDYFYVP